jgi:hypothetical protein
MKIKILFGTLLTAAGLAQAGSIQMTAPNGVQFPLGWPFAAKTVSQAFSSAAAGTTLYFWDAVNQTWITDSWDDLDQAWSLPNLTIHNGDGFLWENLSGSDVTVTLSGTDITTTSVTRTFTANKWYLISDNYLRSNVPFMECVYRQDNGFAQYTTYSLDYTAQVGDFAQTWVPLLADWKAGVRTSSTACDFAPFWQATNPVDPCDNGWGSWTSPAIYPGQGFWFKPASNATWVVPQTEVSCNP